MRGRFVSRTWNYDPTIYAPPRYRKPCAYEAFIPDVLLGAAFTLGGDVAGIVSDAEAAIHALNVSAQPALAPLARLLLRTESIASSKVEGMQVDARSLARAEVRHEAGQTVGAEALEVIGNIDAMQFAVEEASAAVPFTVDQIIEIHRVLLASSPNPRIAGVIREDQNWIGGNDYNPCGAEYVPAPPEEVPRLLNDLVSFFSDEALPPLVQAAIAHAQFETIHPFADGNGRTGRALVQVLLRRRGIAPTYVPPISVVLASEKELYVESLVAFREGRENELIETFATAAARGAHLAASYLKQVDALQEEWRASLRGTADPRGDAAAWAVIDVLPGYPIISVAAGVAATGRVRSAVNGAMEQLVNAGVLVPRSESKRNRAWEAQGLFDLLSDLEQARPPT